MNEPKLMRKEDVELVLKDMLDGFISGDTLEGSITFGVTGPCPYDTDGDGNCANQPRCPYCGPIPYWHVKAAYRVGNLEGQGGYRIIEQAPEPDWFYMSFVDPAEDKFLGGLYVQGNTIEAALTRSHLLGLNPGGEIQTVGPITHARIKEHVPPDQWERLLTKAEVEGDGDHV